MLTILHYKKLPSLKTDTNSPIYIRNDTTAIFLIQPYIKEKQFNIHFTQRVVLYSTDDFGISKINQWLSNELEQFKHAYMNIVCCWRV